jgi:glycosyltransferase involved in cell wall biosynthesis
MSHTSARRILYVQHAGTLGGSCMSLLYTIQGMDRARYTPIVACVRPSAEVVGLYRDAGFEVLEWHGVRTFEHTTARWSRLYLPSGIASAGADLLAWDSSARAMRALIERTRPDLVHLNSAVLAPCAEAVRSTGLPLVWHVREAATRGHLGVRKAMLGRMMLRTADELIFLSEYDRAEWVAAKKGVVIPNFVDFRRFDRSLRRDEARSALGLPDQGPVVLFLGSTARIKGFRTLLRSIPSVLERVPAAVFVMPGAAFGPERTGAIGWALRCLSGANLRIGRAKILAALDRLPPGRVLLRPFASDVERYLAAADLGVFPSERPHFARPVVEAGAMGKPVVASRLGGVTELVEEGVTGLLIPPQDPSALAAAMIRILESRELADAMGNAAFARAHARFRAETGVAAIGSVYGRILS